MRSAGTALSETCVAGGVGAVVPVDIAAAKAIAIARPVDGSEKLPLSEARGRVVAAGLAAASDLPSFDNSAMDGYAVQLSALRGDGPWTLQVGLRLAAGDAVRNDVRGDTAIRIFTGAPVPGGYDAVVMQENCRRTGDAIVILKRPFRGENIRREGEDVRAGTAILRKGDTLTPQRLALLAAQGVSAVDVVRKVRVGLVSTGSELREPGEQLQPGQIYNSNRIMLASMLAAFPWAQIVDLGIVPDRREALSEAFGTAVGCCDVLVTTGGVSAGEEDHVVSALGAHGGVLDVLKVAMRPGKPVKVGLLGDMPFLGLPGNPNATLVTFRQIALPAIRTIAGLSDVMPHWSAGVTGFTYAKRLGRTEFVPVRITGRDDLGRPILAMQGRGSSASLMSMAGSDGIALLPPDVASIEPGLAVRFERID